jgi:hypothetical protein
MLTPASLEILLILMRDSARFASNVSQAQKLFWTQKMELVGDVGHVESHFNLFRDSVCAR